MTKKESDYPEKEEEEKGKTIKFVFNKEILRKDHPELFDNIEFVFRKERETPKKGTPKKGTPKKPQQLTW